MPDLRFIMIAILCVSNIVVAQSAVTTQPAGVVMQTEVDNASDTGEVVFSLGSDDGLEVGDLMWVALDDKTVHWGKVFFVTPDRSAARLSGARQGVPTSQPASVLPRDRILSCRKQLPERTRITGSVVRVAPGRETAWINSGTHSGLTIGDTLLIRRQQIPLARGRVRLIQDETAQVTVLPLVGNATVEPGDEFILWPDSDIKVRARFNSTIMSIRPGSVGRVLTIVGGKQDGLVEGRLVDIYRDGEYVGVASIRDVGLVLSEAWMIEPATKLDPRIGDEALVRHQPSYPPPPLTAVVFRISQDVCLIAAGETDGVQVNEQFIVYHPVPMQKGLERAVAELTVKTVKVDYSGARIRPLISEENPVNRWDMAHRRSKLPMVWQPVGQVTHIDAQGRTLVCHQIGPDLIQPDQVVRFQRTDADTQPGAAVTVSVSGDQAVLYVPPGWGELDDAQGAQIEARVTQSRLTIDERLP